MSQVSLGPVNITFGNSAFFTVEFYDSGGALSVPPGATLAISYTTLANVPQTDTITLALINSFFTGTWSSANAAPGLAPWTITATGMSSIAQSGVIRVLDP